MSIGLHGNCRTTASYNLSDTVQPTCSITLGGNIEHVRKESNQSNEHEQSGQPCESDIVTADTCTASTCTCARTSSRNGYRIPCKCTSGSATTNSRGTATNSIIGRHFNTTSVATSSECNTVTDYIERDYADYINATSAEGQGAGARVRHSIESRNFKQADADSTDSIERRTGIPAGVTV